MWANRASDSSCPNNNLDSPAHVNGSLLFLKKQQGILVKEQDYRGSTRSVARFFGGYSYGFAGYASVRTSRYLCTLILDLSLGFQLNHGTKISKSHLSIDSSSMDAVGDSGDTIIPLHIPLFSSRFDSNYEKLEFRKLDS